MPGKHGRGRGRGRKDSESDIGSTAQDSVGTFETLRDEGEHFVHVKQYKKAIESFTKALDMKEGDKTCLVTRSKCFLMLGDAEKALMDADAALEQDEDGKKDIRALCMKAEALYQKGDFETALVYYHRGNRLRPELQDFRLGIQKSQEAIDNSIGQPESVTLETKGDLSFFYKQEEKQKQQQQMKTYGKPGAVKKEEKKERQRLQNNNGSSQTTKELLGELFRDKDYLEKLFDSMTTPGTNASSYVRDRACDGLEYLNARADFWRQQKPMYARKRDKDKQKQKHQPSSAVRANANPTQYILQELEEIDQVQSEEKHDLCLRKCKKMENRVMEMKDEEVPNRPEVLANIYSCMGNSHLALGNFSKALEFHNKDLDLAKKHELEEAESRALDNIGRTEARMGNYQDAIATWEKKLPLTKSALESTWLYHEIGRCYLEIKKYKQALEYGEKSLAAAKEAGDEGWQLHATVLIGQSEAKSGELQAAVDSFEQALEMAEAQDDKPAQDAIRAAIEDINRKIVQGVQDDKEDDEEDRRSETNRSEGKKSGDEDRQSRKSDTDDKNDNDDNDRAKETDKDRTKETDNDRAKETDNDRAKETDKEN